MSKDKFTFDDIDDILADFYKSYNEAEKKSAELQHESAAKAEPARELRSTAHAEESFDFSAAADKLYARAKAKDKPVDFSDAAGRLNEQPAEKKPADVSAAVPEAKPETFDAPAPATAERKKNSGSSFEEFEALFSREAISREAAAKIAPSAKKHEAPAHKAKHEISAEKEIKKPLKEKPARKPKPEKLDKPGKAEKAPAAFAAPVEPAAEPRKKFSPLHALLSLIFGALSLLVLVWVMFNVHPASASLSTAGGSGVLRLSDKLDVYMNNVASDALGELSYIKKIYTLQENDTVAPVPNPDGFGTTRDVAVIQDVIKRAAPLLEGQTVVFDPNADFVPDTDFMYYLDDTIMVIAWKEYINERCCTIAEVKVAHGSQLRRKLAEDSYSSSVQYYASDMANASNAVVAINGDFYAFRDLGITVYQRNLYRNNPASVDSCFFTASGDMLFSRAGELMGEGEAQQFIEDNDVVFAVAFGPVLVDNGELQYCESYPIGEINMEYSRSCIGMTDDLHYLLMTINHTPDARPRATINELARYIYSKGVEKAYTLDGGQTAEIVMMGGPINHVDFGFERTVSDIIYFATAIPNEEVSQ